MTAAILIALAVVMFAAVLGRGTVALVARGVAALVFVGLLVAVLTGCAPPPPPEVHAPAWMLTPVPTVDIGIDALHAWDCQTQPETICTEWAQPVTN